MLTPVKLKYAALTLATGFIATSFFGVSPATAGEQKPKAVIELFTSQGCSSCPPADRIAADLSTDNNLIVLSFAVDYWDYLGWKDTLASAEFTKRQRAYAAQRGDRQVYTPQMVVNGVMHAVGSDKAEIANCATKNNPVLALGLDKQPSGYRVTVPALAGKSGILVLLPVLKSKTVAIGRGENHGATVTYTNVVRSIIKLGEWKGEQASFDIPAASFKGSEADGFVVMLQASNTNGPGQILAAAKSPVDSRNGTGNGGSEF